MMPTVDVLTEGRAASARRTLRATFVVNPNARGVPSPERLMLAPAWLRVAGWQTAVEYTRGPGHATELARAAAAAGVGVVVAVGGDGTVNEVVNGLVGTDTALAVLPCGTANVWAREIGMPHAPDRAAAAIHRGWLRRVDTGRVGSRHFLLMASLGLDSQVAALVEPLRKRRWGALAYAGRGLREAIAYTSHRAMVWLDGQRLDCNLMVMVVGNTRSYGGVLQVTNEARVDDGLLDVVVYNGSGVNRLLRHLARTLLGRHANTGESVYTQAREIRVELPRPLPVQADGDVVGSTPVEIICAPGSLWAVVPRTYRGPLFRRQLAATLEPVARR